MIPVKEDDPNEPNEEIIAIGVDEGMMRTEDPKVNCSDEEALKEAPKEELPVGDEETPENAEEVLGSRVEENAKPDESSVAGIAEALKNAEEDAKNLLEDSIDEDGKVDREVAVGRVCARVLVWVFLVDVPVLVDLCLWVRLVELEAAVVGVEATRVVPSSPSRNDITAGISLGAISTVSVTGVESPPMTPPVIVAVLVVVHSSKMIMASGSSVDVVLGLPFASTVPRFSVAAGSIVWCVVVWERMNCCSRADWDNEGTGQVPLRY